MIKASSADTPCMNPRRSPLITIARWTAGLGFIGFALGFFGPMIFAPGANQGPLLGIFITGPIGVATGFVAGIVRCIALRTEAQETHHERHATEERWRNAA